MGTRDDSLRKCSAIAGAKTNRPRPCRMAPLVGSDPPLCQAHSGAPIHPSFEANKFKVGNPGGPGVGRVKRYQEILAERIEQQVEAHIEKVFAGLFLALDAELYGESKDGEIVPSGFADAQTRHMAALRILERVLGKAVQPQTLAGADGEGVQVTFAFQPKLLAEPEGGVVDAEGA